MGYIRWGNEDRFISGFMEIIFVVDGLVFEDMLILVYIYKCGM